ncbi:MAG TPA: thiamine phosphate synthase [Caulobacteraceae bacterium]|jgi:thiamine-phosphate pyrophosphorylase|nr:thiamine phosphate synthase [Caulobacteraceae bacterium]
MGRKPLPPLLFFTDPARTPDAAAVIARLPRGSAVVFRAFGRADQLAQAPVLAALARRRGIAFLVGADIALAMALRADGVHLPQRLAARARVARSLRPGWIVTVAAHSLPALRVARQVHADAAVLSPVFASASPSAGAPLGVVRFAGGVRAAGIPVYGLGGINAKTARRLLGSGAIGLAAIEGLRTCQS